MASGKTDADLSAKGVPDENHGPVNPLEQVLLDQIGVVNGVPVGRRDRRLAEAGQIDQMNAMGVLEERGDAAQAFAIAAPSMQKHQVMGRRFSDDFVDEAGSAVIEALDVDESTSHG